MYLHREHGGRRERLVWVQTFGGCRPPQDPCVVGRATGVGLEAGTDPAVGGAALRWVAGSKGYERDRVKSYLRPD